MKINMIHTMDEILQPYVYAEALQRFGLPMLGHHPNEVIPTYRFMWVLNFVYTPVNFDINRHKMMAS